MKHILKGDKDRRVWLNGEELNLKNSQQFRNHSPDGFNWGYAGSGPAQLALAIILKLTGKAEGYQEFKWDMITQIPQDPFEIEFEYPLPKGHKQEIKIL